MSRREAWSAVRSAGGTPTTTVSRRTDLLVVGQGALPIRGDGSVSVLLQRGEELQRRGGRIRIVAEDRFLEMLGRGRHEATDQHKTFDAESAAAAVGVDAPTLRRWEHLGLVRSRDGRCDFRDIVSLQTLTGLMRSGVSMETIARSLSGLSRVLPEAEHPLAQLRLISADRRTLLAQVGGALVDPRGQHHFGFVAQDEVSRDDAGPRALAGQPEEGAVASGEAVSADIWFDRALTAELNEEFDEACALYRRLLGVAPHWGEAYYNMGNCLRMLGKIEAAEEMYKLALVHDPSWESAWYNLADVQEMSGRYADAVESLLKAVEVAPALADAHFNLAHCLDALGRHDDAQAYWRQYLTLDVEGVWADAARSRLAEPVGEPT